MGTGLEMTLNPVGTCLALLALVGLTGCGNDPAALDRGALVRSVANSLTPDRADRPATAPLATPEQVLAQVTGPVILLQSENGDQGYVIGVRDNGPYRTYATADRQTITLRDGLITNSRGLGQDLMASDVSQTAARLINGQPGPARRTLDVLDGEDITRALIFDCQITLGASDLPQTIPGATRRMQETCVPANDTAAGLGFTNNYAMTSAGRILLSRQWIPAQTGALLLQDLRP
jgi:hypothetical protein